MNRVENFKNLGNCAMLPVVNIGKMITTALAQAAAEEKAGDFAEAEDLLEWAMFLESEMRL